MYVSGTPLTPHVPQCAATVPPHTTPLNAAGRTAKEHLTSLEDNRSKLLEVRCGAGFARQVLGACTTTNSPDTFPPSPHHPQARAEAATGQRQRFERVRGTTLADVTAQRHDADAQHAAAVAAVRARAAASLAAAAATGDDAVVVAGGEGGDEAAGDAAAAAPPAGGEE